MGKQYAFGVLTTEQTAWFREIGGHSMKKINAARALFGAWVVLTLLLAMAVGAAAEGETRNLVNGSFEDGQGWKDKPYQQLLLLFSIH